MRHTLMLLLVIGLIALGGCNGYPGAVGFSLPEGNQEAGKQVFVSMLCNSCHSLPGIEQSTLIEGQNISVKLGGEVLHLKTYGDLVTSVINPSHRIAQSYQAQNSDEEKQSAMINYNDVMTVTELVDLVSFLESQYTLRPYEPIRYRDYHM